MSLGNMVNDVAKIMFHRGEKIEDRFYVNKNRNYMIHGERCYYLLKWNDEPFMAAARHVNGIKGIGETINYELYHREFVEKYAWKQCKMILFEWTSSNGIIYGLDVEHFTMKSKTYVQKNGEKVLVISVSDLVRFE